MSPPAETVPAPAEPPKGAADPSGTMNTRKRRLTEHQSMPVSATQRSPMPFRTSAVVPVHHTCDQTFSTTGSKSQNHRAAEAEAEGAVETASETAEAEESISKSLPSVVFTYFQIYSKH